MPSRRNKKVKQQSFAVNDFKGKSANANTWNAYKSKDVCANPICARHRQTIAKDAKMKKCSRCLMAHYCSPACQKTNWPSHKQFCLTPEDPKRISFEQMMKCIESKKLEEFSTLLDEDVKSNTDARFLKTFGALGLMHIAAEMEHGSPFVAKLHEVGMPIDDKNLLWGTPLFTACLRGNLKSAKLLVQANANINNINKRGLGSLAAACEKNHVKVVKFLLESKASKESSVASPLFRAAQAGSDKICKMLLQDGADPDAPLDSGYSPLFIAAQFNHKTVVKTLLDANASATRVMGDGTNVLFAAAQSNHAEVLKMLLEKKANVNHARPDGITPLQVASGTGHMACVRLLVEGKAMILTMNKRRLNACSMAKTHQIKSYLKKEAMKQQQIVEAFMSYNDELSEMAFSKGNEAVWELYVSGKMTFDELMPEGYDPDYKNDYMDLFMGI